MIITIKKNKHLLIDSYNQERFGIKATGEAERVNKRKAPLSERRGTMKGNYRGSGSWSSKEIIL